MFDLLTYLPWFGVPVLARKDCDCIVLNCSVSGSESGTGRAERILPAGFYVGVVMKSSQPWMHCQDREAWAMQPLGSPLLPNKFISRVISHYQIAQLNLRTAWEQNKTTTESSHIRAVSAIKTLLSRLCTPITFRISITCISMNWCLMR